MKILQIDHLSYKDEDKSILSDISFDVHKGDCISIIGESGSGKSTLLKLCADLIEITEGSMRYKGKDYKTYEPIELRRNIIFVPEVLLLDEVTAALDTTNAQVIENYIKELNEAGVTVLWVTHNLKQSERIFNKRIVIANGQLERMEELN